eukprot:TRINITY_DN12153_c0_g2_i1.p1 TRINITY_DN12153_c0_g2~~TRINITY_DN12153_c0_g2_i1.p1  ORF type:complete len:257 (-),score=28.86 TRINITY_DN12153_c0_g2_i1:386-1051(-)
MSSKLRYAMVCASNMNRSMEAHYQLKKEGFRVESYGVGQHVKIPGPTQDKPNVYKFGEVTYEDILADLLSQNLSLYKKKGMLDMLNRNKGVKKQPERWQGNNQIFDVVITFEERILDRVLEDLAQRNSLEFQAVLIINMDVKDNHAEAQNAGQLTLKLCRMIEECGNWLEEIDKVMQKFEMETGRSAVFTIQFYRPRYACNGTCGEKEQNTNSSESLPTPE